MRFSIISFALGVCLLQQQPQLPPLAWALLLAPILALWWRLNLRATSNRGGRLRSLVLDKDASLSAAGGNRGQSHPRCAGPLLPAHIAKLAAMLLAQAMFAGAGFFYAAAWAQWRLAERLPPQWEGVDLFATGVVAGLPQPFDGGVRFDFDVEQVEPAEARLPQGVPGHRADPRRRALALFRAPAASARQRQSGRLRLRVLAAATRHRCH